MFIPLGIYKNHDEYILRSSFYDRISGLRTKYLNLYTQFFIRNLTRSLELRFLRNEQILGQKFLNSSLVGGIMNLCPDITISNYRDCGRLVWYKLERKTNPSKWYWLCCDNAIIANYLGAGHVNSRRLLCNAWFTHVIIETI